MTGVTAANMRPSPPAALASATIPLGDRTGLSAPMTGADAEMSSMPAASMPDDQPGDFIDGQPFRRHDRVVQGETRLERVCDEMRTVEQHQRSVVAIRDGAKARDEGVLAAGDALHDRVFGSRDAAPGSPFEQSSKRAPGRASRQAIR